MNKININGELYSFHTVTLSNKEIKRLRKGETLIFVNHNLENAIAVEFVKDKEVTD